MNHVSPESTSIHRRVEFALAGCLIVYLVVLFGGFTPDLSSHVEKHEETAHPLAVLPFAGLLLAIAVFPLWEVSRHWWEKNLSKFLLAVGLAGITLAYLAFGHPDASLNRAWQTFLHVLLKDYIPFIVLLFTVYTIGGGIRIAGNLPAHPLVNLTFIAVGGILASFIGTTGAAMIFIRPLLETNRERKHVAHTVVFFIFVACNCGGLLLPLGDPPLFLGYLAGVPFLWTMTLWKNWLLVNGLLLVVYFIWDHYWSYPQEAKSDIQRDEAHRHRLHFAGLWPNVPLLIGVVLSAAFLDPTKNFPGTETPVWPFLREAVQLGLVLIWLLLTPATLRAHNGFSYSAIVEVACLFIGIFLCMQPALEILAARGSELGITSPSSFFWASGFLSSVLDNAPTYLVFFNTAKSLTDNSLANSAQVAGVAVSLLTAISLGSVFMGAMTYIGNGPNFMVKSIAEEMNVKMPSFFGYMLYSFGVLLPILIVRQWVLG